MKGDWVVGPGGQTYLDTTDDPTVALDAANARAARMKTQRDQARTALTTVQAAHDLLASQLAKVEAAIASAGLSIQQAEQP